jgi:hypothetical protein
MAGKARVNAQNFAQVKGLHNQGRSYTYIHDATGISMGTIQRILSSSSLKTYQRDMKAYARANYEKYGKAYNARQQAQKGHVKVGTAPSVGVIPLIEDEVNSPPAPRRATRIKRSPAPARRATVPATPKITIRSLSKDIRALTRQVNNLSKNTPQVVMTRPQPRRSILARIFS